MCGIIGYIGEQPAVPVLIEGLRRMEYRGYDSAGIALIGANGVGLRRSAGKLANLEVAIEREPVDGLYGVGHTRWATHGKPTQENAHPHRDCTGRIVVVHNGIIENYLALKLQLEHQGHRFQTQTDSEVIAHLVEHEMGDDGLEHAVFRALQTMHGQFAIAVASFEDPHKIVAARNGPPLVIGVGDGEFFVASDVAAILRHTRDVVFLADAEIAVVTREGVQFLDGNGRPISKAIQRLLWDPRMVEKCGYKHFMLKEIHEQPTAVRDTLIDRVSLDRERMRLEGLNLSQQTLQSLNKVAIVACGTSWHAGLVGKYLIEALAGVPVEVDYASEFRYRDPVIQAHTLAIAITQSGETADTLAALREAHDKGAATLAVCNVEGSMATREADGTLYTYAGPEIGVASTKAFTTQIVVLQLLALEIAHARGRLSDSEVRQHVESLLRLPCLIERAIAACGCLEQVAERFCHRTDFLFLGRGINYPVALEGALKLKELSYIHAEGYPAGEMKHGPIALIDEEMPVVALAPNDAVFEKMVGNVQEAKARGAHIIAVVTEGDDRMASVLDASRDVLIAMPQAAPLLTPVIMTIPLQLLAYHIAARRGCDVDQPRNLAKSVTVE